MKKKVQNISACFFILLPCCLVSQEWEQVGHWSSFEPAVFDVFADSVDNILYFGGKFDTVDYAHSGNICAYNGKSIESLKIGVNDCWNLGCRGLYSFGRYKGEIYASVIRSVENSDSNLIGIGKWNGQKWSNVGHGINSLLNITSPGEIHDFHIWNDTLYVAGIFKRVDDKPADGVAAWDGEHWHTFDVPQDPNGAVLASSVAVYKNHIYMGGNFKLPIAGVDVYDLARYDGISWQSFGGGLKGGLSNLSDLEVFNDKLYVSGYFSKQDGNPGNSIMAWDGEHWDDLGGGASIPQGYSYVNNMLVNNGKLYVVGYFDNIGGVLANNVAVWDGKTWCSIGNSVFDESPKSIAVYHDTVFVCGGFNSIGGYPIRQLAKFIGDPANNICGTVTTKTPESPANTLQITPNPALQAIRVTLPATLKTAQLTAFNALGQPVLSKRLENLPEPAVVLDVSVWPSGVYLVEGRTEDGQVWGGRFLKG